MQKIGTSDNALCSLKSIDIGYCSVRSRSRSSMTLVSSIDAEIIAGNFVCLIGRNGSGKSTLLRTIAGLQKPLSGTITFSTTTGSNKSARVGIILTKMPDLKNTTVFELISYGRIPHMNLLSKIRQSDIEAVNNAMILTGISDMRDRKFSELSDGERQKVMIAQLLARETDVLLLDEPAAFLDYYNRRELMELLKNIAHNYSKAIILSTHDLDLANAYADNFWHIKQGMMEVTTHIGEL